MIVVSNTSPIINLAAVGHLGLLLQLYRQIRIPEAVYKEIVIAGAGQPGADEVHTADWIKMGKVTNESFVRLLEIELDAGEAEALALALELKADLVLLDERRARKTRHRLRKST